MAKMDKFIEVEDPLVVARGRRREGAVLANGYELSTWGDEIF
jgi:hypothetical protein